MFDEAASESHSEPTLKLMPLGGLGEVGMNCMAISWGEELVIIDYGMTFPDGDMPGINVIIPDPAWVAERADRVTAIILTHGHEDHIGAMPWLMRALTRKVPVYGPPMAMGLLRHKLRERNLLKSAELHDKECGERVKLSKAFSFEFVHVNHSMPDCCAVALSTPAGTIVHTGDWRFDPTPIVEAPMDLQRFAQLGREGVLCMLGDSTNVGQKGSPTSERDVIRGIEEVMLDAPGRVMVTMFSSNVHRVQGLMEVAHAQGRRVLLMGRSLQNSVGIALELGRLRLPSPDTLLENPSQIKDLDPEEILILCTGSQGEARAALTRIASDDHHQLVMEEGDVVIFSARIVPGNELPVGEVINTLWRKGVEVVTPWDATVHTTGHAYAPQMEMLLQLVQPKHFMPVHGEPQMLYKHARLARKMGIEEVHVLLNGDSLEFGRRGAKFKKGHAHHRLNIDNSDLGVVTEDMLRQRRRMAQNGVVVAAISLDTTQGDIVAGPEFAAQGVVMEGNYDDILEDARQFVLECFDSLDDDDICNPKKVSEHLRNSTRRFFQRAFNTKPDIVPIVLEVVSAPED